jgi:rhodanese-related sulfurtransferase
MIRIFIMLAAMAMSSTLWAQKRINKDLNAEEFSKGITAPGIQLLDVRTAQEFGQGHIKNALNYDILGDDFERNIVNLKKDKPVYVYCHAGGRSAEAAGILGKKGFKEIYNLTGGITAWKKAAKPVE